MKYLIIMFLVMNNLNSYASDAEEFLNWLDSHKDYFKKCQTQDMGEYYELCDKTQISKSKLKNIFSLDKKSLREFIEHEKLNLIIVKNDQENKELGKLFGKYLPGQQTILLKEGVTNGILIHEYLHHLQWINQNLVFGKRYKFERAKIQNELVGSMDESIIESKKANNTTQSKTIFEKVKKASEELMRFGYWQDLIDERAIFNLYLKYGEELKILKEDLDLAQKNMNFICERENLKDPVCKLNNLNPKYIQTVLDIIKEIRPTYDDKQIVKFLANVPEKTDGNLEKTIKDLNQYIYKNVKIKPDISYKSIKNQDNILPDSVLKLKQAHCLGLSTLFLMAFEKMKLKAYLVRTPGHVFVRACENDKCRNIETLKFGEEISDSDYEKNYLIQKSSISEGFYLKSLVSEKELASSIYLGLGFVTFEHKQYDLSEYFYKKSIDQSRGFAEAYGNLAAVFFHLGHIRQAWAYTNMSLKINPDYVSGYINQGILFQSENKLNEALKSYDKALELNPTSINAYARRAKLHLKMNNQNKTINDLENILIINNRDCSAMNEINRLGKEKKYKKIVKDIENKRNCINFFNKD